MSNTPAQTHAQLDIDIRPRTARDSAELVVRLPIEGEDNNHRPEVRGLTATSGTRGRAPDLALPTWGRIRPESVPTHEHLKAPTKTDGSSREPFA